MAEQFGEKKYDPTPHRRQQARREGQVAKSQDLVSVVLLCAGVCVLLVMGKQVAGTLGSYAQTLLSEPLDVRASTESVVAYALRIGWVVTVILAPLLAALFIVAVAANLLQTGWLFLPSKLGLDLKRIDPASGVKRLFSVANVVRLAFGLFKVAVVTAVAGASLWQEKDRLLALAGLSVAQIAGYVTDVALWTSLKVAAALLVLALLDLLYQRWRMDQELRMTEQEMREELKQTQGDPQIQARRRAVQRQMVMNRLDQSVPKADFLVTNPTELAIALKYDMKTMAAPVVVAKGAGALAQRMRRLALEAGIPIVERKELARALYREVDVNQPIPEAHYNAVAEVLRYVYDLQGRPAPSRADAPRSSAAA